MAGNSIAEAGKALNISIMSSTVGALIGITGIFVGVSALILILSIMSGFLEESRRAHRADPARLGNIKTIGVDEHIWRPSKIASIDKAVEHCSAYLNCNIDIRWIDDYSASL